MADITLIMERRGYPEETHFSFSYTPVRDETGAVSGFFCPCTEITRQVMAEEALRTSEARLTSVLEQVPVGVGMFDTQGRYTLTNPRLRALVGDLIPSRDGRDGHLWQGFDTSGRPIPREDYPGARVLKGEDASTPVDFRHVERDGTERWLRVSAVPDRDGSGTVTGGLTVVQDVTGELQVLRSL